MWRITIIQYGWGLKKKLAGTIRAEAQRFQDQKESLQHPSTFQILLKYFSRRWPNDFPLLWHILTIYFSLCRESVHFSCAFSHVRQIMTQVTREGCWRKCWTTWGLLVFFRFFSFEFFHFSRLQQDPDEPRVMRLKWTYEVRKFGRSRRLWKSLWKTKKKQLIFFQTFFVLPKTQLEFNSEKVWDLQMNPSECRCHTSMSSL